MIDIPIFIFGISGIGITGSGIKSSSAQGVGISGCPHCLLQEDEVKQLQLQCSNLLGEVEIIQLVTTYNLLLGEVEIYKLDTNKEPYSLEVKKFTFHFCPLCCFQDLFRIRKGLLLNYELCGTVSLLYLWVSLRIFEE